MNENEFELKRKPSDGVFFTKRDFGVCPSHWTNEPLKNKCEKFSKIVDDLLHQPPIVKQSDTVGNCRYVTARNASHQEDIDDEQARLGPYLPIEANIVPFTDKHLAEILRRKIELNFRHQINLLKIHSDLGSQIEMKLENLLGENEKKFRNHATIGLDHALKEYMKVLNAFGGEAMMSIEANVSSR